MIDERDLSHFDVRSKRLKWIVDGLGEGLSLWSHVYGGASKDVLIIWQEQKSTPPIPVVTIQREHVRLETEDVTASGALIKK